MIENDTTMEGILADIATRANFNEIMDGVC